MGLFKIKHGKGTPKSYEEGTGYLNDKNGQLNICIGKDDQNEDIVVEVASSKIITTSGVIDGNKLLTDDSEIDIEHGGTGANTAEEARRNLDIYSKDEINDSFKGTLSVSYTVTLQANGWIQQNDSTYHYIYENSELVCGKNNDIPPIISWISNYEDYNKIETADAKSGIGITFISNVKITKDIDIVIIDVK